MYCKHCGKELPDYAHFCRFCGGEVTPLTTPPVTGPAPEIPNLNPDEPAAIEPQPWAVPNEEIPNDLGVSGESASYDPQMQDYESNFGVGVTAGYMSNAYEEPGEAFSADYEDILREFSEVEPPAFQDTPLPPPVSPTPPQSGGNQKFSNKKLLILVSAAMMILILVLAIFLCIKVLIPKSQPNDPVEQEQYTMEVTPTASASQKPSPSPSPSSSPAASPSPTASPQISPPKATSVVVVTPSPSATVSPSTKPTVSANPSPSVSPKPSASATPSATPAPVNNTVVGKCYVNWVAQSAYFRSSAEQSDKNIVATIPIGTELGFIEDGPNGYSRVKYNNSYGYVATSYLSTTAPNLKVKGSVYVANVDFCAYLRSSPQQSDSNIVDYVYLDQELSYIETTSNNYVHVKVGERYGYVSADYISTSAPPTSSSIQMYVTGVKVGAYFMQYPRLGTTVLETLPAGTAVGYIENSANGFCRVTYNGKIGFVLGEYLTETAPGTDNQQVRESLISYALKADLCSYCFMDLNGDGIDEMIAGSTYTYFDDMLTTTYCHILFYKDGNIVDSGVLGQESSTEPVGIVTQKDGTIKLITDYIPDSDNRTVGIHTLSADGKVTSEIWSMETSGGSKHYYVTSNGKKAETTEASYLAAVGITCELPEFDVLGIG